MSKRAWWQVDWKWYIPPEDTVYRPTEIQAFEHLDYLAGLIRASGHRVTFSDSEWKIFLKDIELRRKHINSNVTPVLIADHLQGYTPPQVESIQRQISLIMALREEMCLPALPALPIYMRRSAKFIMGKAA